MRIARLVVVFLIAAGAAAEKPQLEFSGSGLNVRGLQRGGRTAWMALVRERVGYHTEVRVYRGLAPAGQDGLARIDGKAAEAPRALWIVADVDRGQGARGTSPGRTASPIDVPIDAAAGQATITIHAGEAHVLYVHPPAHAWATEVSDGSDRDADGAADGRITLALSTLTALQGNVKPPDAVRSGDLVLVIDSRSVRSGEAVVK